MKDKPIGINHVALKVGDVDEALKFYGKLFDFKLREQETGHIEIDMGDQFLALEDDNAPDAEAHFGFVVEDKERVRQMLKDSGIEIVGSRLDFRDPWGNRIQIVQYDEIQFTKTDSVLKSLGVNSKKTKSALDELKSKGLA